MFIGKDGLCFKGTPDQRNGNGHYEVTDADRNLTAIGYANRVLKCMMDLIYDTDNSDHSLVVAKQQRIRRDRNIRDIMPFFHRIHEII